MEENLSESTGSIQYGMRTLVPGKGNNIFLTEKVERSLHVLQLCWLAKKGKLTVKYATI